MRLGSMTAGRKLMRGLKAIHSHLAAYLGELKDKARLAVKRIQKVDFAFPKSYALLRPRIPEHER